MLRTISKPISVTRNITTTQGSIISAGSGPQGAWPTGCARGPATASSSSASISESDSSPTSNRSSTSLLSSSSSSSAALRLGLGLGLGLGRRLGPLIYFTLVVEGHHLAAALVLGGAVRLVQGQVEVGAFQVGVGLVQRHRLRARLLLQGGHLEVGLEDVLLPFGPGIRLSQVAAVVQLHLQ